MMASYRLQHKNKKFNSFTILIVPMMVLLLLVYTVDIVKSDQIDCKDIQCPPDIKCPSDSISHVLYEPLQIPPDEDEIIDNVNDNDIIKNINIKNSNNINNDNDINKTQHIQKGHISKFILDNNDYENDEYNDYMDDGTNENLNTNSNYHHHNLNKRSVQYKRKETIKIVPGDYISLTPDQSYNIVNYDQQNTNNLQSNYIQKKRKREIDNESKRSNEEKLLSSATSLSSSPSSSTISNETDKCCLKKLCICKDKCVFPKCEKLNKITIEIEPGNGEPGKCCPMYKCIDHEPDCENSKPTDIQKFWIKHCMKCECISGQRICQNSCIDDVDDDDGYNPKSKKECFSAKKQKPFKNGEIWTEDNCTECECVDGEKICQISSCMPKTCKQIRLPDECCPVCVEDYNKNDNVFGNNSSLKISTESSSSSFSTEENTNDYLTTEIQNSQLSTTESSMMTTTSKNQSSSQNSTMILTTQLTTKISSTTTTTPTTINESIIKHSPRNCPPVVYRAAEPTLNTHTTSSSDPDKLFTLFGTSRKNLILYGIIIVLVLFCFVFIGLYVNELTKKTSYRSIPSSDSNLSQVPRPITIPIP